ncbi:MAG: hypothetical protein ACREBB_02330 [Nitrosotalea sp.]
MFFDWTIPLFIGIVGGPLAIIFRMWYKKKGPETSSKFADNGTYVRDDSLYSYNNTTENKADENDKKNNS